MSMPSFPQNGANMTREEALTMIIASIAMEELALSHILNAEGEKLQYILGTLPGASPCPPGQTAARVPQHLLPQARQLEGASFTRFRPAWGRARRRTWRRARRNTRPRRARRRTRLGLRPECLYGPVHTECLYRVPGERDGKNSSQAVALRRVYRRAARMLLHGTHGGGGGGGTGQNCST